jgi:hypothetical protein
VNGRTFEALRKLSLARKQVPVESVWNHRKGGVYAVTGHALDTDSGEIRVVYRRIGGPEFDPAQESELRYARRVEEWTEDRFVPAHNMSQH